MTMKQIHLCILHMTCMQHRSRHCYNDPRSDRLVIRSSPVTICFVSGRRRVAARVAADGRVQEIQHLSGVSKCPILGILDITL